MSDFVPQVLEAWFPAVSMFQRVPVTLVVVVVALIPLSFMKGSSWQVPRPVGEFLPHGVLLYLSTRGVFSLPQT